jgi:hypothetical protein
MATADTWSKRRAKLDRARKSRKARGLKAPPARNTRNPRLRYMPPKRRSVSPATGKARPGRSALPGLSRTSREATRGVYTQRSRSPLMKRRKPRVGVSMLDRMTRPTAPQIPPQSRRGARNKNNVSVSPGRTAPVMGVETPTAGKRRKRAAPPIVRRRGAAITSKAAYRFTPHTTALDKRGPLANREKTQAQKRAESPSKRKKAASQRPAAKLAAAPKKRSVASLVQEARTGKLASPPSLDTRTKKFTAAKLNTRTSRRPLSRGRTGSPRAAVGSSASTVSKRRAPKGLGARSIAASKQRRRASLKSSNLAVGWGRTKKKRTGKR